MRFLDTKNFSNFWFETGTPRFLIDLLKTYEYDLSTIENFFATELGFSSYEVDRMAPETQEKYYQTIFYLIMRLVGIYTHAEVKTNKGRIRVAFDVTLKNISQWITRNI